MKVTHHKTNAQYYAYCYRHIKRRQRIKENIITALYFVPVIAFVVILFTKF